MRKVTICLAGLGAIALLIFAMPMSAQNPQYPTLDYPFPGFPPEFSPLNTSRPAKPQPPLIPQSKFVRVSNRIPNRYIVVLNDDVIDSGAPLAERRAAVTAIANAHALTHLGSVGYIYATALKGFSIHLPNEAAALAISRNPQVKWVEEVGGLNFQQEGGDEEYLQQSNPPWGLDAIDGSIPVGTINSNGTTTGLYIYNATGNGVNAFVLDSGLRRTHQEFMNRSPVWADCIRYANCSSGQPSPYGDVCAYPKPNDSDNDCRGHGTHVAGTLGGTNYGIAKQVTIIPVKVCLNTLIYGVDCPFDAVNAGIDWVANYHSVVSYVPAVANMSLAADSRIYGYVFDNAVQNSINSGVTFVGSAGNSQDDVTYFSPAHLPAVISVGATNSTNSRPSWSNFGRLDLFAPGDYILSAFNTSDTATLIGTGTSMAAPHVAGAVAMYLQGRTGTAYCPSIQGPAAWVGGSISTCPDRVARFIAANANLNRLSNVNGVVYDQYGNPSTVTSPNRFLLTSAIPTTANPISNHRFFVWQQYADFLPSQPEPDENGLDWWTNEIIGHGHCVAGLNDTTACTQTWRALTSRAFWVASHGDLFNGSYGLNPGRNSDFVTLCYQIYLRRNPDIEGFNWWVNNLAWNYGDPANATGVLNAIDSFINSLEYRQRFGQP